MRSLQTTIPCFLLIFISADGDGMLTPGTYRDRPTLKGRVLTFHDFNRRWRRASGGQSGAAGRGVIR